MKFTLEFPEFRFTFDRETGYAATFYPNDRWSGCSPIMAPGDVYHAEKLGITPQEHRFVHEIGHHLVGMALGFTSSPVVWRDAHHIDQAAMNQYPAPPGVALWGLPADTEEWLVTATTYHAFNCMYAADREGNYFSALVYMVEKDVDVDTLSRQLRWYLDATRYAPVGGVIRNDFVY